MMVAIAILAILSAIAIPAYQTYVYKSRASEAVELLSEIRIREESYFADRLGEGYCQASADADSYNPRGPRDTSTQEWANPAIWQPTLDNWPELGVKPPGPSLYFAYNVLAGARYDAPTWLGATDNWFIATAIGDLNGDGRFVTFQAYSGGAGLYISEPAGWQ